MTFEELMTKLNDWLTNEWNPNHEHKLNLQRVGEGSYQLFSTRNNQRPLMSFKAEYAPPRYAYIHLDVCKTFLGNEQSVFFEDYLKLVTEDKQCGISRSRPVMRA